MIKVNEVKVDKVVKSTIVRLNIIVDATKVLSSTNDKRRAWEAYLTIARNINDIVSTLRLYRNDMYRLLKLKVGP